MSPSPVKIIRSAARWLPTAAVFALAPKCLACLAAYAGVGAVLGLKVGGAELCGAMPDSPGPAIAWLGMTSLAIGGWMLHRRLG